MPLSEEEKEKILNSAPKGTWFILFIYGVISTAAWLALYFGRFLAHGPVQ